MTMASRLNIDRLDLSLVVILSKSSSKDLLLEHVEEAEDDDDAKVRASYFMLKTEYLGDLR